MAMNHSNSLLYLSVPLPPQRSPGRIAGPNNLTNLEMQPGGVAGPREEGGRVNLDLQAAKQRGQIWKSRSCILKGMDGLLCNRGCTESSKINVWFSKSSMTSIEAIFLKLFFWAKG